MQETRPARITSPIVSLSDDYVRLMPLALIVGVVGLAVSLFFSGLFGGFDLKRFSYTYLVNFCVLLTVSLGGLFFVAVTHVTRAGWSVTVRRIAEIFAMCTPVMFILFLPILIPLLLGSSSVYTWNQAGWSMLGNPEVVQEIQRSNQIPPLESLKAAYLNRPFFTARVIAYFVIWGFMAWFYWRNSLAQDKSGDKRLTSKMQAFSGPALIVLAATLAMASFDFEMSLAPMWFSTMFPVYFFAGAALSGISAICLTALLLQRSGRVTDEITVDHYHDLSKLMFTFIVFWSYIAFSQFMLIWYANIPEETVWYDSRINDRGWATLSLILLFGHFVIPFLGLMARTVRRSKPFLIGAAIYLLVLHWMDHYWLVMPQYGAENEFAFNPLIDIPCSIGMVGLYIAIFCLIAGDRPLVPLKDPRLGEALNYHNH